MPELSKGQSTERNGDGRPINLPGKYVQAKTGKVVLTQPGDEGIVQADALMQPRWAQVGAPWHRAGDVPSRLEVKEMQKAQAIKDAKAESADKKELEAAIK